TTQSVRVTVQGDTTPEPDETFFLNLSNPANANLLKAQGTGTIQNDDAAVSIDNITAAEGDAGTTAFTFTVSLAAAVSVPVTVNYGAGGGPATANSDYLATSGVVTFAPGETSKPVTVVVIGDRTNDADETFMVTLSNPVNAVLGSASRGT